jgi:hypothetical protein
VASARKRLAIGFVVAILSGTVGLIISISGLCAQNLRGSRPTEKRSMEEASSGSLLGTDEEQTRRREYGYPTEIALSRAIEIFNEENRSNPLYAPYTPLTEEEVIAAIVAGPDEGRGGEIWQKISPVLWKIATDKTLPKGSLLYAGTGGILQQSPLNRSGSIRARGMTISLLLGLDETPDGIRIRRRPDQALVIRKTYYDIETK